MGNELMLVKNKILIYNGSCKRGDDMGVSSSGRGRGFEGKVGFCLVSFLLFEECSVVNVEVD